MAQRDRAQGFGFMYADISKLIAKKKELEKQGAFTSVTEATAQTINMNRDPQPVSTATNPKADPSVNMAVNSQAFLKERARGVQQIKENLDRLQSLHHKLHAMLEEMNKITEREKKRN